MQIEQKEGIACLRALVAVARADGQISPDERAVLAAALEAVPGRHDLEAFLDEQLEVETVLADIKTPAARDHLWESAYSLIHADGSASVEEQKLLDRIRVLYDVNDAKVSATQRLIAETKDTLLPSNIDPIADPVLRQREIEQDVVKYSVLSAVLGAFPVPGIAIATDLAIVALQVKLVRDIGQYWGHKVDKEAAKTLLGGLGLGTGARIAVSNLAKLVPVWGSAFGAATAFATTWALGKIANRYFESGKNADVGQLRNELRAMAKQGKAVYAAQKDAIETKRSQSVEVLATLNERRKAGAISQAEYERQVAALAD